MQNVRLNPDFEIRWKKGPICRQIVLAEAQRARGIYVEIVAKRSGNLARSAQASAARSSDGSWEGWLTVGGPDAPYEAAHELRPDPQDLLPGGEAPKDLARVLKILDATR